MLFERAGRIEVAVEIKRSTSPGLSTDFQLGIRTLQPRAAHVVHGGADGRWPAAKGVEAISLREHMQKFAK